MLYKIILIYFLIGISNSFSQVFTLNSFNSGQPIDANLLNQNFQNIKNSLNQYYAIDLSYTVLNNNEHIKSATVQQNFQNLANIVDNMHIPSLSAQSVSANQINSIFNEFLNKFELKYHVSSCETLKIRGFNSGYYGIDFDGFNQQENPVALYCEFDIESANAWTQVAKVNYNDSLWNAWSTDQNLDKTSTTESFGVRLNRFTSDIKGRDLEVMLKVNGQYVDQVYYDVNLNNSFNPIFSTGTNAQNQDGFFYRNMGESSYTRCGVTIESSNSQWNWSIADVGNTTCGGYTSRGGFLLASSSSATPEIANVLYGLNSYNAASFSTVEIFVRKRQLTYPISCQHALDNGLITISNYYNMDVDSDGTSQQIYCSISGSIAYTLLVNFGNNDDYSNRGVLRNGVRTNSQAAVVAAGFTTNATSWNHGDYPTSASYLQFFRGGDTTGYIYIRGPKWGSTVLSTYRALNGAGNYVRFRISNQSGSTNYGVIQNTSTTQTVGYSYSDSAFLWWEEYPSSVAGIDIIWIR